MLESGDACSDGGRLSHSTFKDDVSIENGDIARGDGGGSALMWPIPRVRARAAHEAGGSGAAGAASFSRGATQTLVYRLSKASQQ